MLLKLFGITILILFLIILSLGYFFSFEEKKSLNHILNLTEQQIKVLQKQKEEFKEALSLEKKKTREFKKNLKKLKEEFVSAKELIRQLNSRIEELSFHNENLKQEKEKLNEEITALAKENLQLKSKLNSLEELKRAIRELKTRLYAPRFKIETKSDLDLQGNQGYIIRDGKPTYFKVKINVIPQE